MTPTVSVIADDLSGASSVGAEFARCGLSTVIVQDTGALASERAEVVIFDTESRYDTTERARGKASDAGRALREIGAPILLKKFDLLLRGPIGHEIDAIMESAGHAQCVFVGAAPKMGRITVGGYQLVDGVPVKEQITKMTLIDSQLSRVTWPGWFALNGLEMPRGPRPSFDRAALAISAAADGMGVALETTRLAERELTRDDLIELGADVFAPLARETHFLSYRVNERNVEKVKCFCDWLVEKAGLGETAEA